MSVKVAIVTEPPLVRISTTTPHFATTQCLRLAGIGRATTIALAKAGWLSPLWLVGQISSARLPPLCRSCQCVRLRRRRYHSRDVVKLFSETVARFGRLDLVFNNAGITGPDAPLEDVPLSEFQKLLGVNIVGPFLCTQEAFKVFKAQSPPGGRIINNGSISAQTPRPNSAPYTLSKHAITGLTKSTALDGRAFNITCTQVDIGGAQTALSPPPGGRIQPNGTFSEEATFDAKHVGEAIVHIASLPLDVTVLVFNIMATQMPFVGRG
ncbi:short-chain dehydrogenase/reductase SDR [Epithele typhae]|uniref:short-chain dehydrogenase/reductase SDR n=1 Tax=Epithele typhae TaxID=378194 RepID=UPI002007D09E|nr:short-chain dehydrogenase/reductase SDR [Epithele typhae]KAH9924628.1 short-chain dehydrogenase/reductase SDR [Epithele typhae]